MHKPPGKGQREGAVETAAGTVTIVSLSGGAGAGADATRLAPAGSAVLVAGEDAAAVGEVVAALRAAGMAAAGWVGDPSDEAVREMALELFPGCEIVVASDG